MPQLDVRVSEIPKTRNCLVRSKRIVRRQQLIDHPNLAMVIGDSSAEYVSHSCSTFGRKKRVGWPPFETSDIYIGRILVCDR